MRKWHDLLEAQVRARPDALAFTDSGGARFTYDDLTLAVSELSDVLTECGVSAGDRVLIVAENCVAAVASLFACSRIGAIAVPVNARQTQAELDRIAEHARPAAILLTTAISDNAVEHASRLGARAVEGVFGRMHLATPFSSSPVEHRDLAVILYTTGTTGDPKGVMLTHDNVLFGGQVSADLRDMTPDDVIYGGLPITHVFGLASVVTASVLAGAQVRLEARFTAARLHAALTEDVTLLSAVPQMHALLMQYAKEQGIEALQGTRLRYTSSGAAPLDPAWKRKAEQFYGVALQNGFGMTETTAGVCASVNPIGTPDISCGPPLPGVEVRIDESVAGGGDGAGEVLVRGPNVMKGYFRNPAETERVLSPEGWLRTGDLGRIDASGNLHILGRSKELIIHGGFNVYPPEVEAALNDHPQVIQSAVIGQVVDGDEKVLAFVQAAPDDLPDVDDLRAFAADRLAGYKRPSQIVVASELPAAPTGKILKHKLLAFFADRLA